MRAQSWILNLVAAAIATSAAVIAYAQEPQKQSPEKSAQSTKDNQPGSKKKEEDDSISRFLITTYLSTINVSVTDSNDRPISGLRREDFAIFEDDVKQEIEFWFHDNSSVSFGLAFDVSDYEPLRLMARQAAGSLVRQTRSSDVIAIPQFKIDSGAVPDFASDRRKLENALSDISSKKRLDGLVAETIKSAIEKSKDPRSAVVVITDGLSLSGAASDRDAAYAILRMGTPVYFIILDDGRYIASPAAQSRVRRTRDLLTRLARVSGGLALVVKNEDEISAATERIIQRLKSQYTIGYTPTNDKFDGSFRNIRVIVTPKDKRKVNMFAPSGYYAVDPEKIREENFK
jgi:Ca-activated chloride channel family protein